MTKTLVEVKKLSKKYNNKHGIENVSFTLNSGEIIAFIGPSGSGKTTTIKTMLNLLRKDEGDVKFFDKDIKKHFTSIMEFVGYLPSDEYKDNKMTVIQFLRYANSFYETNYSINISKLLAQFSLDPNRKINELSLGEKKKLSIINAFFHEPKILLLDEPTESLDPLMQIEFFKLVEERKKAGATILFTSHQLSNISIYADRVLIINNGKITKDIPISELKQIHKRVTFVANKEFVYRLENLEGVKDLTVKDDRATFLYVGDINPLLKRLASFDLEELLIENPSIDELFLHFYNE